MHVIVTLLVILAVVCSALAWLAAPKNGMAMNEFADRHIAGVFLRAAIVFWAIAIVLYALPRMLA